MHKYTRLLPGDPIPRFYHRSPSNPRYAFDTTGGRYIVLGFFGSMETGGARAASSAIEARKDFFNDEHACFFGVSIDPNDESQERIQERFPGRRLIWDFDLAVSKIFGAVPIDLKEAKETPFQQMWVVLDPTLHVMKVIPFENNQEDIAKLFTFLDALPPPDQFSGFPIQAPIIVLPNVFEPEICQELIGLYEEHGGSESGFMREINGKTQKILDDSHKKRSDYVIEDKGLIERFQQRFMRRVIPEILKVHQYKVTRMERYIVACYSAEDGGHFRPHRDNTTKGTAHRRFAVSVNLNTDFDGGEVYFPEYGSRSFKPPVGGAVVFSCSLLHAVTRVTRGRRYAFLPFLYDEEAAKIRERNNVFLGEGVGAYTSKDEPEKA